MCSMEDNKAPYSSDNSDKIDAIFSECDNSNSAPVAKLFKDGDISKSSVELIKNLPDILLNGRLTSLNITINDIKGDNYNDNATNSGAGHDNIYSGPVCINTHLSDDNCSESSPAVYDLSDYNTVYKYLKEQQHNPYCSFLIVLSIFENSQFDLVSDESKVLYSLLAEEHKDIAKENGDVGAIHREPFEISRQETINYFGLRFYKDTLITISGRFETTFISFSAENHASNILRCVYSEFVALKDKVTAFLTKLICSEKLSLYAASINALKKLCDISPEYFVSKIVIRLMQNKSIPSDIAVAQIFCSIAEHSKSEYCADKYLSFVPIIERDIHYYIIILMMCKTLSYKRAKIGKLIRPILWELINQPKVQFVLNRLKIDLPDEEDFINNIDLFYNIGNRYAEYYIALISELSDILKQINRNDTRRDIVHFITLQFIREDYSESCLNTSDPAKFKDMIFIRMILRDKTTCENLTTLWGELLKSRKFKESAERILENYLLMRNGFVNDQAEYLKIEDFFSKLANVEIVRNNLIFFLNNISTRPRKPIPLASRIYQNIGGNLHG